MLVKLYGKPQEEIRYSPADVLGTKKTGMSGNPAPKDVSTSQFERQNLTIRMSMRRFTRLTNGFSKKLANHIHALAIHYFHYNFIRIHQTLKCTPAMEANVVTFKYEIGDMIELLDRHLEKVRIEKLEERRKKRNSN